MPKFAAIFTAFVLSLTFFSVNASALELKVYDSLGLVRAYSKIKDSANVEVKIQGADHSTQNLPADIIISHLDGLSPDKHLQRSTGNVYRAEALAPGSWKIMLPDTKFVVSEVKITEILRPDVHS